MKIGTEETLHTIKVFFMMGAAGVAAGLLFDIFRAFHVSFKGAGEAFDKVSVQITDVIFVLSSFCLFTLGIYIFNDGVLRSYCILGAAAGVCAYFLALAPFINRLLRFIFKIAYIIISGIIRGVIKLPRSILRRLPRLRRKKKA